MVAVTTSNPFDRTPAPTPADVLADRLADRARRHREFKQYRVSVDYTDEDAARDAAAAERLRELEAENKRLHGLTEGDPSSIYHEAAELRDRLRAMTPDPATVEEVRADVAVLRRELDPAVCDCAVCRSAARSASRLAAVYGIDPGDAR